MVSKRWSLRQAVTAKVKTVLAAAVPAPAPRQPREPPAASDVGAGPLWLAFEKRVRQRGAAPALVTQDRTVSFAELFAAAESLAGVLAERGIAPGDRVGLSLPNGPDFAITFLALCRLSTTVLLVSTRYGSAEGHAIVRGLAPRVFITVAGDAGLSDGAVGALRLDLAEGPGLGASLRLLFPLANPLSSDDAASAPTVLSQAAVVKLTSGSTGEPKAVVLSAANVLAEAENVVTTLSLAPSDRIVVPVPLYHSYGFDLGLLSMLTAGCALVLREVFVPRQAWRDLNDPSTTVFLGVPSMYRFLCEVAPPSPPTLLHLRYLLSCTAPLPEELIANFRERFGVSICQHYGSSETGAVANHVPGRVAERLGSVGRPLHGVTVRVVGDDGVDVPVGQEGELVVESRAVAIGYAMGAPPEPSPLRTPTFRTGDLGVVDGEGFLFVRGRKDDVINVGGMKVYPLEVVRVLETHPSVREAAVAAMRDASGEQAVYAAVTLREREHDHEHVSASELVAHCKGQLADYRVPRRIDIMDELPRGPTGKVRLKAPEETPAR